jgi:hypothetical protein
MKSYATHFYELSERKIIMKTRNYFGYIPLAVRIIFSLGSLMYISYISVNAMTNVQYLSPSPGSTFVSQQSNIIVRWGQRLDPSLPSDPSVISVTGTASGNISGRTVLSDDQKTLLFLPEKNYLPGEKISISVRNGIHSLIGEELAPVHFTFIVNPLSKFDKETLDQTASEINYDSEQASGRKILHGIVSSLSKSGATTSTASAPLPSIKVSTSPTPGAIFLSTWKGAFTKAGTIDVPSDEQYLLIMDNNENMIFSRPTVERAFDFRMLPNGNFVYFDENTSSNVILNSSYQVIDNYMCGNGYKTDLHEFILLPNGHALLLGLDPHIVNMSAIVNGGDTAATVTGFVIQELDNSKNVVFQWRSFDHFAITDATHENLAAPLIDYAHPNALTIDADSNIIVSDRHMDEITKIDRTTGDILWRWGGKNNQFTFINDSLGFSHQHSINRIDNGNFILFDNGNFHTPQFSRALEYQVDEKAKTATLVWQFRHSPDVFTVAMGSVQRLSNGNTFIGWGASTMGATEVRSDGNTVYEIQFPDTVFSYRALKYTLNTTTSAPENLQMPASSSLSQNYPNPFNPSTNITFSIPDVQYVSLKVYDLLGKEITTLINNTMNPGSHSVQWNAANIPSGVYFYRLQAGSFMDTKKLVLLR